MRPSIYFLKPYDQTNKQKNNRWFELSLAPPVPLIRRQQLKEEREAQHLNTLEYCKLLPGIISKIYFGIKGQIKTVLFPMCSISAVSASLKCMCLIMGRHFTVTDLGWSHLAHHHQLWVSVTPSWRLKDKLLKF